VFMTPNQVMDVFDIAVRSHDSSSTSLSSIACCAAATAVRDLQYWWLAKAAHGRQHCLSRYLALARLQTPEDQGEHNSVLAQALTMRLWQGLSQLHKLLKWVAVYIDIPFLSLCYCFIRHPCHALCLLQGASVCQGPHLEQILIDHHSSCFLITLLASCICLVTDLPDGVQTARPV